MSTKCITDVSQYSVRQSGAERERGSGKSGERERRGEQEAAQRKAGVTKIGLSAQWEIGRSRSAHMLWPQHSCST